MAGLARPLHVRVGGNSVSLHENSLQAYREEQVKLSHRAQSIFDIYRYQPSRLWTDRDILECLRFQGHPAVDMNYCRPRITEIRDAGLIEEVGKTIDRTTKKPVRLTRFAQPQPAKQQELALV